MLGAHHCSFHPMDSNQDKPLCLMSMCLHTQIIIYSNQWMHSFLVGQPLEGKQTLFLLNLNKVKSTSLGSIHPTLPLLFFLPNSSLLTRIIFPLGIMKLSCSHHFLPAQLILASNPWLSGLSFVSEFKRNTEDLCHSSAISRLNQHGGRSQPRFTSSKPNQRDDSQRYSSNTLCNINIEWHDWSQQEIFCPCSTMKEIEIETIHCNSHILDRFKIILRRSARCQPVTCSQPQWNYQMEDWWVLPFS